MDEETEKLRMISAGAAARFAALTPEERTSKLPSQSMRKRSRRGLSGTLKSLRRELGPSGLIVLGVVVVALIYVGLI